MQLTNEWIERGKTEGRVEGRMEGRVEGRMEGRMEGRRELVLRQLRRQIGPVPPELLERVAALVFQIGLSVLMWRGVRAGVNRIRRTPGISPSRGCEP